MSTDQSAKAEQHSDEESATPGPKPKLYAAGREMFEFRFEDEAGIDNFGMSEPTDVVDSGT